MVSFSLEVLSAGALLIVLKAEFSFELILIENSKYEVVENSKYDSFLLIGIPQRSFCGLNICSNVLTNWSVEFITRLSVLANRSENFISRSSVLAT